ncbi:MAG: BrnT family toxin [Actinobacteria bacterium]|nr:MAG: BrnT family toxin [Actinomycetota bacterium]
MSREEHIAPNTFEYDHAKSEANKVKHGIDFVEARALWLDDNLVRVAARAAGEPRLVFIGVIGEKHWSAVITNRGGAISIISVRRARQTEVRAYECE